MSTRPAEALFPGLWTEHTGRRLGPYLVFMTLIAATISWRSKNYFEGAIDSVVVLKGILSLVGLVLAALIGASRPKRPVRAGPMVFLLLYLGCTVLGGWGADALFSSIVVAARVLLLAVALVLLAGSYDGQELIGCLIAALATFAVAASVTGIPSLADGRLRGALPPLHPNELASICALVILWCLWRMLAGEDAVPHLVGIVVASAVMIATGSRTPMVALVLGVLVLVLHASALRLRTVLLGLAAVPILFWVIAGTDFLGEVFTRGQGTAGLTTLSNRTIAWQAALAPKDSAWLSWLGGGLSMKRIEVPGQFWNEQILDSSWVSALVQGGLIGLALCVLWLLGTLIATLDSPVRLRALQLALVVFLASRGLLESGLFDASTAFLVFFLTSLATPVRPGLSPAPFAQSSSLVTPRVGAR